MNWLLKQLFYLRYLILKQDLSICGTYWKFLKPWQITFQSKNFEDGHWHDALPWRWKDCWNTYGIFSQQYGKWYFKAKLNGLVTDKRWPAIWMLELNNEPGKTWYYEIDIELFLTHFGYTVWWNHNGPQEGAKVVRANFHSRKLYRRLQKDYHLFLIDWSKDWIKMYINGILTAKFYNKIHTPLQIIMSRLEMSKTIVQK